MRNRKTRNAILQDTGKMTTFKKHVTTQTYAWLLGKLELHNAWLPTADLWRTCPYNKLDITEREFYELVRQMKQDESW